MTNQKKQKKQKKTKKTTQVLPRTAPPWFCFFVFFVFFGSLFFFGFCFFLCFLSCRRFLCVGAMSARGLSSCICQRFAWIDMHFMCILRTLVLPCSEKKTLVTKDHPEKKTICGCLDAFCQNKKKQQKKLPQKILDIN